MREVLDVLERRIDEAKRAPLMLKAAALDLALGAAMAVLRDVAARIERLEGERP